MNFCTENCRRPTFPSPVNRLPFPLQDFGRDLVTSLNDTERARQPIPWSLLNFALARRSKRITPGFLAGAD